jgi:uncharacterized membrane protein YgdD (TMEM256/DUF423 family)
VVETFFILGSLLAGLSVGLGAFGAHALRSRLSAERLANFETGACYQMYHSLALLATGLAGSQWINNVWIQASGILFFAGIVLFSGSLYFLAVTDRRWLGAITPFGGLAWIAGWLCLMLGLLVV